nr:cell wall hydrolase [uncultured Cohaesibacter sp.]
MSKSSLGPKSLGLTTCLMISTGLILSFTQSLDEDRSAAVSQADLRQQGWTNEMLAQASVSLPASPKPHSDNPILARAALAAAPAPQSGLVRKTAQASASQFSKGTYIQISEPAANKPLIGSNLPYHVEKFADIEEPLSVNENNKGDRRRRWSWEPFKVSHGRREIAMNWSGSVWHMASPLLEENNDDLPKLTFEPAEDLSLVMADAQQFLKTETNPAGSDMMYAQNDEGDQAPNTADGIITGSTALAYAPTSSATDAPFEAILTEQRKGEISEDNQVTILGAIDDFNSEKTADQTEQTTELAAIAPIDALPRVRAPYKPAPSELADNSKVSKPLDISPIVAAVETYSASNDAAFTDEDKEKSVPLTLAKSKARRAELQLAKLSGDDEGEANKKKSRWASWFNFSSKKAKIDARGEHAWVTNKLPKSSYTEKQKTCLANAIYFESRSEPEDGQVAVGQVVLNRVKNPAYPNTICGVVYQNQNKRNACQFSFACDGIPDRVRSKKAWDLAWKLANEVVNEEVWLKSVGSSTHYHATYVHPKWARTMKKRKKIGLHIFYKTYGGGWS